MNIVVEEKSFPYTGQAVHIFEAFRREPYPFLLESSLPHPALGRYSFIGFDPFEVMTGRQGRDLGRLAEHFYRYACLREKIRHPFPGGMMGYLTYDFGLSLEKIFNNPRPIRRHEGVTVPDCMFGFYDCVIALDHFSGRISVLSTGLPEKTPALRRSRAKERLLRILRQLRTISWDRPKDDGSSGKKISGRPPRLASNFKKSDYLKAVLRCLDYIRRGDIYQVNLSQRFCFDTVAAGCAVDPARLYRILRRLSPSCFGGYFDGGDFQIISSSPERFLRVRGDRVETRPMKGTRPRGKTRSGDLRRERELWQSVKDKAELLMITDLERNDLGRVCCPGSIRVEEMRTLEKYTTVFQTTSTVTGRLAEGRNVLDLLRAAFPGGSITGCPKIRAMQIIDELEPSPRSIYTGAMGYVGFQGDMDFNILIRTFLATKKKISFQAGGGIVSDSRPEREYAETLVKARAMKDCLQQACAGSRT